MVERAGWREFELVNWRWMTWTLGSQFQTRGSEQEEKVDTDDVVRVEFSLDLVEFRVEFCLDLGQVTLDLLGSLRGA